MASEKIMTSSAAFILLLLCQQLQGYSCQSASSPGAKLRLSQIGLNYAADVTTDILSAKVRQATIGDQSGSWSGFGKVNYGITSVRVTGFQKPTSTVRVNAGSGMTLSLAGIGITVGGNWNYNYKLWFIKIRDSGSFTASVSGATLSVSVTFGPLSSTQQQLTISATGCSCNVGDARLRLSGGASWLYNLFVGVFMGRLKSFLQTAACKAATDAINKNANEELKTLVLRVPFGNGFVFDYSLTSSPLFQSGYIETSHKGECFYKGNYTEAPFHPAQIVTQSTTTRMVTIWLTEYTINTVGYVAYRNNLLRFDEPLAKGLPLFGSSAIGNFPLEVRVKAIAAPTFNIHNSFMTANINGQANINTRFTNGTVASVLAVQLNLTLSVSPRFNGTFLTASVTSLNVSAHVISSAIGNIADSDLSATFNMLATTYVIPKLNQFGARGFPVPHLKYISFPNAALQLKQGVIVVMTDVSYP